MKKYLFPLLAIIAIVSLSACKDRKSYTDLLNDENIAVNSFLANQRVEGKVPADSVFQVGPDAPYYQLDEEGNIFMQVLNPGTKGNKATDGQLIYFRFLRYNLELYANGELPEGSGNATDVSLGNTAFKFNDYSTQSSYQWGTGLQMPLRYLPIDCEVNIVIKSQYGVYSEMANVIPYLYNIRYYKSQI